MSEEEMIKFVQIRNTYARKDFGNLSNEDKALHKYEGFCLELMKEIEQLKEKINTYENPEDLTLMFMYCDEKAKDGSKPLLPHYTNNFTIEFVPAEFIFDYLDVEKWIEDKLNNETLIIEDCVAMLFDYINETYQPEFLAVTSEVNDALHGPVVVTKTSEM